jgi:NDP-sugar pyrophosphorylase family protein
MDRPLHKIGAAEEKGAALDVVILCGGQGTRRRPVIPDVPKVLAPVGGRPFLSLVLERVRAQGFQRIILCIGYGGGMVRKAFEDEVPSLLFSEENEPLGTGGALKKALPLIQTEDFIVMNGDTFCPASLHALADFHRARRSALSLVLNRSARSDGGAIALDAHERITHFKEKESVVGTGFLSAGIYAMRKEVETFMPQTPTFSLEFDVFPTLIRSVPCFGFVADEEVIDIGTPKRYHEATMHFTKGKRAGEDTV